MKSHFTHVTAAFVAVGVLASSAYSASLDDTFRNPPDSSRPWCYYYWISDNISREGITKDLEAMKFEIADPGLKIPYVPDKEGLDACFRLGQRIGEAISSE